MRNYSKSGHSSLAHTNKTYAVAREVGLAIVTGEYGVEGLIPREKDICLEYEVSRTVAREAIKMLASKQMVVSRMSQGTWIKPENSWNLLDRDILTWLTKRTFSVQLLNEFHETRLAIEPSAAGLTSTTLSNESQTEIEEHLEHIKTVSTKGGDILTATTRFHLCLLNACQNRFYRQFSSFIRNAIKYQHNFRISQNRILVTDVTLYENIYNSLLKHDQIEASEAMKNLLSL